MKKMMNRKDLKVLDKGPAKPKRQEQSTYTFTESQMDDIDIKEVPDKEDNDYKLYVLRQIEIDNMRDIEDPFVCLNEDHRAVKVNKKPLFCEPDHKLKNLKLDLQDSNFWFLKGHDHQMKGEMDSAIDSYRQAIRMD